MKCTLHVCEIYKETRSGYIKTTYFTDIVEQQKNVDLKVLLGEKKFY